VSKTQKEGEDKTRERGFYQEGKREESTKRERNRGYGFELVGKKSGG
jgi:hypothetical protein